MKEGGIIGASASKKWVRMEDTGCGDEEGKAVLEGGSASMEEFLWNIHRQI